MYDPNLPTSFDYRDGEQPVEVRFKPCPFCGSVPDLFEDGEIQCSNKKCPVRPSAKWGGVEVWNTRFAPASAAPIKHYFCSCGGALTAEEYITHLFELGHDRGNPASAAPVVDISPIDMILFCPRCGTQHIDAPEDETSFRHRMEAWSLNAEWQDRTPQRWTNPPHKSHLCHNCFAVWRPADVPTNGVAQIKTRGKEDNTWTNSAAVPAAATAAPQQLDTRPSCWHCGVVLADAPKLRCEDCPDECDVEGCEELGCAPAPVEQTVYVSEHPVTLHCNTYGLVQVKSFKCPHGDGQLVVGATPVEQKIDEATMEWALRELADGWVQNNERDGPYGFYQNARRVLEAIANRTQ